MSSKEYFDQIADQWDQIRQGFFSDGVREKAVSVVVPKEGLIAADIGAGTGFMSEKLLAIGLKVIAVDQSAEMVAWMKKKFGDASIEYRQGDGENLPLEDGLVDYVFANMYLHHMESPQVALKEMVRILKPGGVLAITDLDQHEHRFLVEEQQDRWMGFCRKDIRHWFDEAGLAQVDILNIGENCCTTSCCGGESAAISIFLATGQKKD